MGRRAWDCIIREEKRRRWELCFPWPRVASPGFRPLRFVTIAVVFLLAALAVTPARAQGGTDDLYIFEYSTLACSSRNRQNAVAVLSLGQCQQWSDETTQEATALLIDYALCPDSLIDGEDDVEILIGYYSEANVAPSGNTPYASINHFYSTVDEYSSGALQGPASYDFSYSIPPVVQWLTFERTVPTTQRTRTRAYIGASEESQSADVFLSICYLGIDGEIPEPEIDYCPDGTEVLSETISLSAGSAWQTTVSESPYPRLYARYSFTEPGVNGLLHYVDIRANDEQVTRRFYGDEMQTWDPVEGWSNNAYIFSVPNVDDPEYSDYEPTGYVEGDGEVDLYAATGYNDLELVSVCLVPVTTSEYCPDGIEALEDLEPVFLRASGGMWERRLTSEISGTTHYVVRYRVANPKPGGSPLDPTVITGKFMPQIQANFYYVEASITDAITFTLPTSGVLPLIDDYLNLKFYNRYDAVLLESVCVIDGSDEYYNHLTEDDCNLYNPDFFTAPAPGDWSTDGSVNHYPASDEVHLGAGLVFQPPIQARGNVWQLEVRAYSATSDEMSYGTQRSSLFDRGPQMNTDVLGPSYGLYRNNIFVMPQDYVIVQSDAATVDYVCLMERAGVFDVPDCDDVCPVWDPAGSGDPLLIYLIKYLADIVVCWICMILRFLAVMANTLWVMLEDILLRIPALPNVLSENFWAELLLFIRLAFEGFQDWIGQFFFQDIQAWVRAIIDDIGRWFGWQWRRVGQWLDWLLYDIVVWLAAQLGATPQDIFDLLYDLQYEARMFWVEMQAEILNETASAFHLLVNAADVLIILANGVRAGVSGNEIAYIGSDFGGIGGFIWDGVEFVNDAVDATPLSGLNIVALGVLTIGLLGWSLQKFMRMLEAFS